MSYGDLYEGTAAEGTEGIIVGASVVGAVINLLFAAGLAILGIFNNRGRNGARITTWVLGGISLCCSGFGLAGTALTSSMNFDSSTSGANAGPSSAEVEAALNRALPSWYEPLSTVLDGDLAAGDSRRGHPAGAAGRPTRSSASRSRPGIRTSSSPTRVSPATRRRASRPTRRASPISPGQQQYPQGQQPYQPGQQPYPPSQPPAPGAAAVSRVSRRPPGSPSGPPSAPPWLRGLHAADRPLGPAGRRTTSGRRPIRPRRPGPDREDRRAPGRPVGSCPTDHSGSRQCRMPCSRRSQRRRRHAGR